MDGWEEYLKNVIIVFRITYIQRTKLWVQRSTPEFG